MLPTKIAIKCQHLLLQLERLELRRNILVGNLPETWSRLSNVSQLDAITPLMCNCCLLKLIPTSYKWTR